MELNETLPTRRILNVGAESCETRKSTGRIARHGTPICGTDPAHPGLIIQKLPDGTKRLGKFNNRQFVVSKKKVRKAAR